MDEKPRRESPSFLRRLALAFLLAGVATGAVTMIVLAAFAVVYA